MKGLVLEDWNFCSYKDTNEGICTISKELFEFILRCAIADLRGTLLNNEYIASVQTNNLTEFKYYLELFASNVLPSSNLEFLNSLNWKLEDDYISKKAAKIVVPKEYAEPFKEYLYEFRYRVDVITTLPNGNLLTYVYIPEDIDNFHSRIAAFKKELAKNTNLQGFQPEDWTMKNGMAYCRVKDTKIFDFLNGFKPTIEVSLIKLSSSFYLVSVERLLLNLQVFSNVLRLYTDNIELAATDYAFLDPHKWIKVYKGNSYSHYRSMIIPTTFLDSLKSLFASSKLKTYEGFRCSNDKIVLNVYIETMTAQENFNASLEVYRSYLIESISDESELISEPSLFSKARSLLKGKYESIRHRQLGFSKWSRFMSCRKS